MKVLLVNGSPKAKGCTYTALQEAAAALEKQGIETEIFQVGNQPVAGCIGCGACRKEGECFRKDVVNEFVKKAGEADGFIFGSPIHYASASGALTSFMDRAFFSGGSKMVQLQVSTRSTNISPSIICRWFLPSTGIWYTEIRRRK